MKRGFTLTEILITIAVIGILSAIAVPNYRRHVARSRQSSAKRELAAIAMTQHSFYAAYNTYHADLPAMGFAPMGVNPVNYSDNSYADDSRFYATSTGAHNDFVEAPEPILLSSLGLQFSGRPPRYNGFFHLYIGNCGVTYAEASDATGGAQGSATRTSFRTVAKGCPARYSAVPADWDVISLDQDGKFEVFQNGIK